MLPALLSLFGCAQEDPLADLDERYRRVQVDLGAANRDTTRNVHNKEARRRKVAAEGARVALFREPGVQATIRDAAAAPAGSLALAKGASYTRAQLVAAAWTETEKAEETRLLGALDEIASHDASWSSQDGSVRIPLGRSWNTVSEAADALDEPARQSLAEVWVQHRMQAVGTELQELVRLRNQVAARAGYTNYWELALAGQGLAPAEVDGLIAEILPVVQPVTTAVAARVSAAASASGVADTFANHPFLRRSAGLEQGGNEAEAWFDGDQAEDRLLTALQELGLDTSGIQIYSGPTRYVRPGVYGFAISPPDHVAVVLSVDERFSMWPYEALAHELGHTVWWRALTPEASASPALWEPTPAWFEGFAQFFERMVFEPAFAKRYVPEFPESGHDALWRWRARDAAESIAEAIVETRVERRLYEDPSDLAAIFSFAAAQRRELMGTPEPPATAAGIPYDPALTSSLLWNEPAYSQNYLYAYSTEAWLSQSVKAAVGEPVGNAKVGPLLREKLVQASATTPFPDRVASLGGGARADALADYLKAAVE